MTRLELEKARADLLGLSREVPKRRVSPYGALDADYDEVRRIGRKGYEALYFLLDRYEERE